MANVICFTEEIMVSMGVGPDIVDITARLNAVLDAAGIRKGTLHATSLGSTGSLTTIEYEPGVVEDLKRAVTELAPPDRSYAHEEAWHDGNGHSHIQAALLGPSLVVPIRQGRMSLGTWQQVIVINHDNCTRDRKVGVTIIGEA